MSRSIPFLAPACLSLSLLVSGFATQAHAGASLRATFAAMSQRFSTSATKGKTTALVSKERAAADDPFAQAKTTRELAIAAHARVPGALGEVLRGLDERGFDFAYVARQKLSIEHRIVSFGPRAQLSFHQSGSIQVTVDIPTDNPRLAPDLHPSERVYRDKRFIVSIYDHKMLTKLEHYVPEVSNAKIAATLDTWATKMTSLRKGDVAPQPITVHEQHAYSFVDASESAYISPNRTGFEWWTHETVQPSFHPSAPLRTWVTGWAHEQMRGFAHHEPVFEVSTQRPLSPTDLERVALAYMEVASTHVTNEGDLKRVADRVMRRMVSLSLELKAGDHRRAEVTQSLTQSLQTFSKAMSDPQIARTMLDDLRQHPDAKPSWETGRRMAPGWERIELEWQRNAEL